jgi:hypothetical protein
MAIAEKLQNIAENEQKVYNAGFEAGKAQGSGGENNFWDFFQDYGNRNMYRYCFYGAYWNDATYNPKYPIICEGLSADMFYGSEITDTKVPIKVTSSGAGARLFASGTIKIIRELEVTEEVTFTNWFNGATELTDITVSGTIANDLSFPNSSKLTAKSINSIISALKNISDTGTTKTLTLGSVNLAKITTEEKAVATAKGWKLA